MPAENFAPGQPGGVDPSKTYLIKGKTLQDLLRKTIFNPNDFQVQEDKLKRQVSLRPVSLDGGENFDIHLRDISLLIEGNLDDGLFISVTQNYEPIVLAVRGGNFVGQGEYPAPDPLSVPIYSYIGRISTGHPSNNDTGPVLESP